MIPHCMLGPDRICTQPSSPACFLSTGLQGHASMLARVWPCCLERVEVQQGFDPQTGVRFVERGQPVRHLGIRLSTDPSAAAEETYTGTLGSVRQVANHRVSRQLTQIGMVHVAKQVLASKVTYYAIFIPMSEPHARELDSCLSGFVGGSSATLRPGRAAFALPWEQGGMRLTQVSGVGSPGVRVLLHQEDPGPWHQQRTCTSLCQGL